IVFFQASFHGFIPGDWARGTSINAHYTGIIIGIFFVRKVYNYIFNKRNHKELLILFMIFLAFVLTGTKQFLLGLFVSFCFILFMQIKYRFVKILGSILIVPAFLFMINFADTSIKARIINSQKVKGYLTFITLVKDEPHILFLGTSIGTYSSRASLALSSENVVAKGESRGLPIEHTTYYLRKYFSKLYSPEYYLMIKEMHRLDTLNTPFSSIVAIVTELGLIGIILLIIIFKKIKRKLTKLILIDKSLYYQIITLFYAYLVLFFFENWLGIPYIIFPYLLHVVYGLKKAELAENYCE
ncbi:hypothetical protein ACFL20_06240, partial [Spirochaetota bacterium]